MAPPHRQAVAEIAQKALRPNKLFDAEATERKREEAARSVQPVKSIIRAREVVVAKGQPVTERHIAICQALGLIQPRIDWVRMATLLALLALLAIGYGYFLAILNFFFPLFFCFYYLQQTNQQSSLFHQLRFHFW